MTGAKKKVCAYLFIGIVAFTVVAVLAAQASARVSRRRAEQLLHDLRQLQVGKSTFEEARSMVMGHGGEVSRFDHSGCSPAHCTFDVTIHHYPLFVELWGWYLSEEAILRVLRVFPLLGLQDWEAGATVRVDGEVVTQVNYSVLVRAGGGWVLGRATDEFLEVPPYLRPRMGQRSYFVNWVNITTPGGGEGIQSTLTPEASDQERNRAYDFDFDCLTRLGGCSSLCQSAPVSFADLVKESNEMPWLDEHDPHCADFKSLERKPPDTPKP
jgi:hypothetical protein